MSGFTSNTLLIRIPIILSVEIVYRMHKLERRMVKTNAMNTQGDVLPVFIVCYSYRIAKCIKSNNKGKYNVPLFYDSWFGLWPNEIVCTIKVGGFFLRVAKVGEGVGGSQGGVTWRICYLPTCFVRMVIIAQSKLWYYLGVAY